MHTTAPIPGYRPRRTAAALLLYFTTTVLALWAARIGPPMLQASVLAAGTLAMGLLLAGLSPYPRWAFLSATGVLSLAALLGPIAVGDPEAWRASASPMLWMHPWWPMVMAWVPARGRRGVCATDAPGAGWLLIGGAVLVALLSYVSAWI